jgi:hypothetical protein
MRSVFKFAMVGAAVMAGSTAYADVALPSTGNSELVLFVRDVNNSARVYARDLGITLNQVLAESVVQSGPYTGPIQQFTYVLPEIGPDAVLSSFLSQPGQYVWTIMAGDSDGTNAVTSPRRYLTTTQVDFAVNPPGIINSQLNSSYGGLNQLFSDLNGALGGANSVQPSGLWGDSGSASGAAAPSWFGAGPINENGLGTAANLYILTSSGGGNGGQARLYQAADIRLNLDGSLEGLGGGAPVPLPAAVWLLGSALAGFAAIGRRRRSAVDATAAA